MSRSSVWEAWQCLDHLCGHSHFNQLEELVRRWTRATGKSRMRVLNSTLSPSPQLGKGIVGDALGMIETRGLVAAIEAGDAMVKAAEVEMMGWQIVGGGLVTTLVRGDVAAVRAATEAGELAARAVGEVVAVHVIARPHTSLLDLLPTTGLSRILAS